ncbi:MAG TPA: hypothetical protein VFC46_07340 [Humisphaera sp.]|nr:hypothetical protein [Humisphaera sp.]
MLTAIKGTFRNGRVELDEDPGIVGEAAVVVTFLKPEKSDTGGPEAKIMTFGMLAEPGRRMSGEDDVKIAEHDDAGWERD